MTPELIIAIVLGLGCIALGWWAMTQAREIDGMRARAERNKPKLRSSETEGLPAVPHAADWTTEDRATMQALVASEFGRKLITRLQATEYVLAVRNAQDTSNTTHAAGVTVGYNHCLRQILSLSQSARAVAEKPNDSGADGDPQPIEREAAEWHARMSP